MGTFETNPRWVPADGFLRFPEEIQLHANLSDLMVLEADDIGTGNSSFHLHVAQ